MFNLAKRSIDRVVFVIGFTKDLSIRTKQFDIEKAFLPLINTPSINTNLPDNYNPHAARITIGQRPISVVFSQVTAQITIVIDNTSDKSMEVIKDSIVKKINLFQNCVDKIIPDKHQRERGIIFTMHYPVDPIQFPNEAVFDHIQSRFFRIPPFGKPASAQFNVGYKTDDNFFITISVAPYQVNSGNVFNIQEEWVDINSLPVIESGIELSIDVNSRPLIDMENQPDEITRVILEKASDFVLNNADEFIGAHK